jgi:hypothetical protein
MGNDKRIETLVIAFGALSIAMAAILLLFAF